MKVSINQKVTTPAGVGFVQGQHESGKWIVRLPVNELSKPYMNTLTPKAHSSGLCLFDISELK